MSTQSKNAKNCLQTALKHNYSDEEVKRCRHEMNDYLELEKSVYFESMKDFDLKFAYNFLTLINGKAKVTKKNSYKSFCICVQKRQRINERLKRK